MTKREKELEAKVEELEKVNETIAFDLDWEKLSAQKRLAVCALANKKNRRGKRGTEPKQPWHKTPKRERKAQPGQVTQIRSTVTRDAFGNRLGSQGYELNSYILPLIEQGKLTRIKPQILSQMSGGRFSPARFRDHLGWLKRHNFI